MGSGSSKIAGGAGGAPSGVTYQQFMSMSDDEKAKIIDNIRAMNIQTPDYLDDSKLQQVVYGLGMKNKPSVMSDSELDAVPGENLFRGVYEGVNMPPPTKEGILDQIRYGDYTQFSGSGGSVYGRGIYFANDLHEAMAYADTVYDGGGIMRAKLSATAKTIDVHDISAQYGKALDRGDALANACKMMDGASTYALAKGYDAITTRGGYKVVLNRGAMIASSVSRSGSMPAGFTPFKFASSGQWSDLKEIK